MNEPIVIQPPVWIPMEGSERYRATFGKVRLRIFAFDEGWGWRIVMDGPAILQEYDDLERTPEAAQSAAWSALREWLGAT